MEAETAKRRYKVSGDREGRILRAAAMLFRERSVDEVKLEEVAERADVAKGLVRYYFGSKIGLFTAVIREEVSKLPEEVDAPPGMPGEQRLLLGTIGWMVWVRDHGHSYRWLLEGRYALHEDLKTIIDGERQRTLDGVAECLGVARSDPDVELTLHGYLGFAEAVMLRWLAAGGEDEIPIAEMLVRTAVHTVRAARPAAG